MSELTPAELAELRRLHEAATPGEWTANGRFVEELEADCWQPVCQCIRLDCDDVDPIRQRNGEVIAAARNALPRLLDEIERLRALLSQRGD